MCKCKVKSIFNSRTTLEHIRDAEPKYSWYDYFYRKYLIVVNNDVLIHLIQYIMINSYQGKVWGGHIP